MERLTKRLNPDEIIKSKRSANIKRCQRKCNLINYGYTREDIAKAIKRIKQIYIHTVHPLSF